MQGAVDSEEVTHANVLLAMGLYPAPPIAEVKPYAKPILKEEVTGAQTKATAQTEILEKALQDAKSNGLHKTILDAMAAELAKSKDLRPKRASKPRAMGPV
jgi:hypothetical protein